MSVGGAVFIGILTLIGVTGLVSVAYGWLGDWSKEPPVIDVGSSSKVAVPKRSTLDPKDLAKRLLVASVAGIVALWISRWIVLGVFAFGLGFAWFSVRQSAKEKERQMQQILALATWVESLKDTMAASAGISEALTISAGIAPTAIRDEVRNLVIRMERQPTAVALQQFAVEIANPVADMIVASFSLALTKQAGSLHEVLGAISQNARDTASMLREVEAGRSEVRTQSKLAVGVISAVCLFMIIAQRESLEQYDSVFGQLALTFILGVFAIAGFMLYKLGKAEPMQRVFSRVALVQIDASAEVAAR